MGMKECRSCGSLQFSDHTGSCPQCGSYAGFDDETFDYSHGIDGEDD
jgi:RNA polymerase subunit RPABC4/transcription elongation factor Spt4